MVSLLTTRFSPTVLDGYHEHTLEELIHSSAIHHSASVGPGSVLRHTEQLRLPHATGHETRPVRRELQATVRFRVHGHRELRATRIFRNVLPQQNGSPVVDGRGFLPY